MIPHPQTELSIYIHIPFCTSRCRYCNFYFETGWSPRVMERTLEGILQELSWYKFQGLLLPGSVKTLYMGGGTPSTVPPEQLNTFLSRFFLILGPENPPEQLQEFCFECNPESISPSLLQVLNFHSVDRISLGVQTFDTDLLGLLGRRATRPIVEQAFEVLSEHWPHELNLDFITGIPGQTREQVLHDLETATGVNPVHFSLYSLTVEENTPLEQYTRLPRQHGGIHPTSGTIHEDLWLAGKDFLEQKGYTHYEVSNFSLPGKESAHNLAYWAMKPYLGLGPGAVSALKSATGPYRRTNPNMFAYSAPSKPWNSFQPEYETPTPRQWLTDYLITGMRTNRGIMRAQLEKDLRFNSEQGLWTLLCEAFEPLVTKQQAICSNLSITLSPASRLIQDPLILSVEQNLENKLQKNQQSLVFVNPSRENIDT